MIVPTVPTPVDALKALTPTPLAVALDAPAAVWDVVTFVPDIEYELPNLEYVAV